ncbi:hypothetical protein F5Y17DRAFT_449836, partial [Xylariaceae sp. FL0594]
MASPDDIQGALAAIRRRVPPVEVRRGRVADLYVLLKRIHGDPYPDPKELWRSPSVSSNVNDMTAMMTVIAGDLGPRIGFECDFGEVFSEQVWFTLDPSIVLSVQEDDAKFLFIGGSRYKDYSFQKIWYLMIVDVEDDVLFFVDPQGAQDDGHLEAHQKMVFKHLRRLWEDSISSTGRQIPAPKMAINLPLVQQTRDICPGIATALNALLILREPEKIWTYVDDGKTEFQPSRRLPLGFIHSLAYCVGRLPDPQRIHIPCYVSAEDLHLQAFMVRPGNTEDTCHLLRSMLGRLPFRADTFSVPCQDVVPRIIDFDSALYIPHSPRAHQLMIGRRPLDGSNLMLWRGETGPRLANVLLCHAQGKVPSACLITAMLHMFLVPFFPGTENARQPTVMIEHVFGSFLSDGLPGHTLWELNLLKSQPKFIVLGHRQQPPPRQQQKQQRRTISLPRYQKPPHPDENDNEDPPHHFFLVIVETATGRTYCLDSMPPQDQNNNNRAEHFAVHKRLRNRWQARLPHLPPIGQMIELPAFTSPERNHSAYLCAYHVYLLFRKPLNLRQADLDASGGKQVQTVLKKVKQYIGVIVRVAPEMCIIKDDPFVDQEEGEGEGVLLKKTTTPRPARGCLAFLTGR